MEVAIMIMLELNMKNHTRKIMLKDEMLFNALLSQNTTLIKKLIKCKYPSYKIDETQFDVVNRYVEVAENGTALYAGLIIRTSLDEFVVLFLKESDPDDDYIVQILDEYTKDLDEKISDAITINKIEISKDLFFRAMR